MPVPGGCSQVGAIRRHALKFVGAEWATLDRGAAAQAGQSTKVNSDERGRSDGPQPTMNGETGSTIVIGIVALIATLVVMWIIARHG